MPSETQIIVINGASGSGKTTVAQQLTNQIDDAVWVHPDGLWDTPSKDAEEIFDLATEEVALIRNGLTAIVDCQIRPKSMLRILKSKNLCACFSVLLHCPDEVRERRLLERQWGEDEFQPIATWAELLFLEATELDIPTFDTSQASKTQVCASIHRRYLEESTDDA